MVNWAFYAKFQIFVRDVNTAKYHVHDFWTSRVAPVVASGVWRSDRLFPSVLQKAIQSNIASLRTDWFRPSDNTCVIIDVFDPYPFPFAWDRARTLRREESGLFNCLLRFGEGQIAGMPSQKDCAQNDADKYLNYMTSSCRFQLLPFNVRFDNKDERGSRFVLTFRRVSFCYLRLNVNLK